MRALEAEHGPVRHVVLGTLALEHKVVSQLCHCCVMVMSRSCNVVFGTFALEHKVVARSCHGCVTVVWRHARHTRARAQGRVTII